MIVISCVQGAEMMAYTRVHQLSAGGDVCVCVTKKETSET